MTVFIRQSIRVLILLILMSVQLKAQTTVNIPITGISGSYQTGSVNATGAKTDGLLTSLSNNNNRGWAVFDLSTIPSGATINAASINFTTTTNSISSSAINYIGGYSWNVNDDPSLLNGFSLYNLLNANSNINFNASSWSINATQNKTLNANGISFISNNIGGKVVFSFVRGSSNLYEIYGYNAASNNLKPELIIQYTPVPNCIGNPTAGIITGVSSVCQNTSFGLSLSNATVASGLSYEWISAPSGSNNWTAIAGATTTSFNSNGINTATDYKLVVTCQNSLLADTTPVFSISLNPSSYCYCTSGASSANDDEIIGFNFGSLNNSSTCNYIVSGIGSLQNQYSNYSSLTPPNVLQGVQVPLSIQIGTCGGNFNNWTKVFIDFNQDGDFNDYNEEVYSSSSSQNGPHIENGTATIPLNALIGNTRLRIVTVETSSGNNVLPCGNYNWGETEDYTINILQAPPCNGTPDAGIISAPTNVCDGNSFNLNTTGYSIASNLVFLWESLDTVSNIWTAISGATTPSLTISNGINKPTNYRLNVTCSNSNLSAISNVVSVSLKPYYLCYCLPSVNVVVNSISHVSILGTTLNNTINSISSGYTIFYPTLTNTTTQLTQGVQYLLQINHTNSNYVSSAWIDFNGNGFYENSEFINLSSNGIVSTSSFVVPSNAFVGTIGMRIRSSTTPLSSSDACTNGLGVEIEDYVLSINQAQPCNGVPNSSIANAPTTVCANSNLTLTATGFSSGAGIAYQWEVSSTGMNQWSVIPGATTPIYVLQNGISEATDFRFKTVCYPNEDMSLSNVITVGLTVFYNCYCQSSATSISDEDIYQFSFGALNNTSICNTLSLGNGSVSGEYNNYKYLTPPTIPIGGNVPFSITVGTCGSLAYPNITAVYIDFNQNGSFIDSGENVYTSTFAASTLPNLQRNLSGVISIPSTISSGITGLRIVTSENANVDACGNYSWGETEDYLINLTTITACSGTPFAASIIAPSSICSGNNFSLNATNYANNSGISFQWQSTASGTNNWTNISGATDPIYTLSNGINTSTSFRLVSTCNFSGNSSNSNTSNVVLNTAIQCYCLPGNTNPTLGDYITNVNLAGVTNTSGMSNNNGFSDYSNSIQPIQLIKNTNYNLSVTIANGGNEFVVAWFDWNQNGQFETTEYYDLGTVSNPTMISQNILVPLTANAGNTKMRIRCKSGGTFNANDACDGYDFGETEDYLLSILAPTPCSANQLISTIMAPALICPNTSFDLLTTNYNAATGLSYQWAMKPLNASTWSDISGATTLNYTYAVGISSATNFRLKITCSNIGTSGFSNEITITPQTNIPLFQVDSLSACGQVNMNAASGFSNYLWGDNSVFATASTFSSGMVYCTASSGACVVIDSLYANVLNLPNIDAGADQFICNGSSVLLNALGGSNYQWSNGIINGVLFTPPITTTFYVSGSGTNGCINSDSVLVHVMPIPAVSIVGGNHSICTGGATTLTASGADSYSWNTGESTNSITTNQVGNYFVIGTTSFGCIDTSSIVSVSIKSLPSLVKIKNNGSNIVCEPNKVNFVIDLAYGSTTGFAYQWNQNGSAIIGATDSVFNASSSGSYALTISGGANCNKTSASKTATIKPLPVATFVASGSTNICAGGIVTLNAPAISGYTYTWLKDGVSVGSGISKNFKLGGNYTVIAKWNGCADTADNLITVVVNPLPIASVTALTASSFCTGDSCTIIASPSTTGNIFQWMNGANILSVASNSLYFAKTTATIKVIITDNNGCLSKTSTTSIKTKVNATPTANITPVGSTILAINSSVKLNASPSSGVTWQWYKNGNIIPNATAKQYLAISSGSYSVAVTKTGCTGISSSVVVTQSGNKQEEFIDVESNFAIIANPNPVNDVFTLKIERRATSLATISLMDIFGKTIYLTLTNESKVQINLSGYSAGFYFVHYKDDLGNAGVLKLLKL